MKSHVKREANPDVRREQLLNAAIKIAKQVGYTNVERNAIADDAGVSMALITNYLGTLPQLQRTLMRYAVKNNIVEIVAQGLACRDRHASKASKELKELAAQFIINN